ncbi:hypothetical protein H312_03179, partial [Anncaliia algerae PRA339]
LPNILRSGAKEFFIEIDEHRSHCNLDSYIFYSNTVCNKYDVNNKNTRTNT